MQQKRVIVTGGAGFIGYHLTKRLLSEGHIVTGFDSLNDYYDPALKHARLATILEEENYTFVQGNLADADAVNAVFERAKPEIVVNLAAQAGVRYSIDHPESYVESNLIGFFRILEACRNYPVEHLVYASSSSVYGNQQKTPFATTDNVDMPISLYAATKKSNELMAYCYSHLYDIPATGLRFFTVYGPWGRPDMAYFGFTNKILAGEPIRVFNHGDLYRDFTYVDDVVEGIVRLMFDPPKAGEGEAMEGAAHRVYNIGNNKPEKLLRFIEILETTIGKTAEKEFLPMQAGDVYQTYADVTPLIRDYDFRPDTPLEVGLARFYDWYRTYYSVED